MEYFQFEHFDNDYDFRTPRRDRRPIINNPAEVPNRADTGTPTRRLPLLRRNHWEPDRQYYGNKPTCIHYDFIWKGQYHLVETLDDGQLPGTISQMTLSLLRVIFGMQDFKHTESIIASDERFPGQEYTCEETIAAISVENTRGHGLRDKV